MAAKRTDDLPVPKHPWHQQHGETDRQFQLFSFWLEQPPENRTSEIVAKHFGVGGEYVQQLSVKHRWPRRAMAHSHWLSQQADAILARAAQQTGFNWADWEIANNEKVRSITERMLARCEQMLSLPVTEMRKEENPVIDPATGQELTDSRGNVVYQTVTTVKPIRFNAADAPRYAEAAMILTRYLAEQNGGADPVPTMPTPIKPIEDMSIEEREAYIAQLRERQQALVTGKPIDLNGGPPS
jgi:hypothetical protein